MKNRNLKHTSNANLAKQNPSLKTEKVEALDKAQLDFSFKNMRCLAELLENTPSSVLGESGELKEMGKTNGLTMTLQEGSTAMTNAKSENANKKVVGEAQKISLEPTETKLRIVRTIEAIDHNYLQKQSKKTTLQKQKNEKKVKKVIEPETTTLFLRYNKLASIQNFIEYVQPIFPALLTNLMWIDLSHNRLIELSPDLGRLKNLKTLYLHANYIFNFSELEKVKNAQLLRTLTIHANPLQSYEQFRIIVHSILPGLKKIDSTLLTKRETERAEVLMKSMKKYPVIKNPQKPAEESENDEDEDQ